MDLRSFDPDVQILLRLQHILLHLNTINRASSNNKSNLSPRAPTNRIHNISLLLNKQEESSKLSPSLHSFTPPSSVSLPHPPMNSPCVYSALPLQKTFSSQPKCCAIGGPSNNSDISSPSSLGVGPYFFPPTLSTQNTDGKTNSQKGKSGSTWRRKRRKAMEIRRLYCCQFPDCNKPYGSESALKVHFKSKHENSEFDNENSGIYKDCQDENEASRLSLHDPKPNAADNSKQLNSLVSSSSSIVGIKRNIPEDFTFPSPSRTRPGGGLRVEDLLQ